MDRAIDVFLLGAAVLMAGLGLACLAAGLLLALAEFGFIEIAHGFVML